MNNFAVESPRKVFWYRMKQHRLAFTSGVIILCIYAVSLFAEFFAPYGPFQHSIRYQYAPPTRLRLWDKQNNTIRLPFVYDMQKSLDPETLKITYQPDPTQTFLITFLPKGFSYKILGIIPCDIHLFGVKGDAQWHVLGTDRLGRDILSRIIYGTRISTSIGLIGVILSLILGISIGGISGYIGGIVDTFVQRIIEFLKSIPKLPMWMALSAALPPGWPAIQIYFFITLILSLMAWTDMARVVRGKFLALREEDFVTAAIVCGAKRGRIIFRHMLPSFLSHIIASVSLAIPGMILGETALSFLGVGLRPPVVSWGVLLQEAQNIQSVAKAPWLLLPAVAVIITVLAFNFLGDGIRDAADPFSIK